MLPLGEATARRAGQMPKMAGLTEVACFECAGDVRAMSVGRLPSGELVLEELLEGPSALLAHGAEKVALYVASEGIGEEELAEFARDENNDMLDLMDSMDKKGVPYRFWGGSVDNVIAFRPKQG